MLLLLLLRVLQHEPLMLFQHQLPLVEAVVVVAFVVVVASVVFVERLLRPVDVVALAVVAVVVAFVVVVPAAVVQEGLAEPPEATGDKAYRGGKRCIGSTLLDSGCF